MALEPESSGRDAVRLLAGPGSDPARRPGTALPAAIAARVLGPASCSGRSTFPRQDQGGMLRMTARLQDGESQQGRARDAA